MQVHGYIIRNDDGDDLCLAGHWHDPGKEPIVNPREILEEIKRGGASTWPSQPTIAIEAFFDSTKPDGQQVTMLGQPERIKVIPGDRESYSRAVERLAQLLRE